ncbi:MAG: peroxiredoxin [Verrucomicrobiota bacterium]
MANRPQVGEKAPEFKAIAVGGEYGSGAVISLGDFAGRDVVLYFYPKDDTPGCTTQACGIRDAWDVLSKRAILLGVSVDGVATHEKFLAKYDLPFPLVSDEKRAVVEAYGVWVEKQMYGKKYFGTERTTFVVGGDGIVRAVFPKVKPVEHVEKLMGKLG